MDIEKIHTNLNKIDENWIFRYRSNSALSLKELMYNEIYFAYSHELNDPLDLGAEIMVNKGSYFVYEFFIEAAFKSINIPRSNDLPPKTIEIIKRISKEYSKTTRNIKEFFIEEHKYWLNDLLKKFSFEIQQFDRFFQNLLNAFLNILPNQLLSVSFSEDYQNPLLWSIYADKHQGFCAIFSPTDKKLKIQNSRRSDFKEYEYKEVNYSSDIIVDLSLMFNNENEFDYQNLFDSYFPKLQEKALFTKNSNWLKEKELRIHKNFNMSFSHLAEKPKKLTAIERTCYFDPIQLVGVIFGYKMKEEAKNEIVKIFESKKQSVKFFQALPIGNDIQIYFIKQNYYAQES